MKTYQDLIALNTNEKLKQDFIKQFIMEHKSSEAYLTASIAEKYDKKENPTIENFQKILYEVTGKAVPDNYSANWKTKSEYFNLFLKQYVQYLLGNGVNWEKPTTKEKVGKMFDYELQKVAKRSLICGQAFGFLNSGKLEVFDLLDFAPLYDEENGSLSAGVRFWQLSDDKPLRATLYEIDGYTDYLWRGNECKILSSKRGYISRVRMSQADGAEIYGYLNYPEFPIVPMFANEYRQSEIVGLREQIDLYDFGKNGFANDVDDISLVYWTLNNAGGMDEVDLAEFIKRMKTVKAAVVGDQVTAESHTVEVPYLSRESLLNRVDKDLYKFSMTMNPEIISSGADTATRVKANYTNLEMWSNEFEYQVLTFLDSILKIIGITDEHPTFTRSSVVNVMETMQALLMAAAYLDDDYITEKALVLLGDGDRAAGIIKKIHTERMNQQATAGVDNAESESDGQIPESTRQAVS